MDGSQSVVVGQFLEVVPRPFLSAVPGIVRHAYGAAVRFSKQFEKPEAHDIMRLVQRVYIESSLRSHAMQHGLRAAARLNRARNCYHTYVKAPPFSLTQSFVRDPSQPVRRAHFRDGYAQTSQLSLLATEELEPVTHVYGIILHGPDPRDLLVPGFIRVRFPVRDCSNYLPEYVDILRDFASTSALPEIPQEEIEDKLDVEISELLKKKKEQR